MVVKAFGFTTLNEVTTAIIRWLLTTGLESFTRAHHSCLCVCIVMRWLGIKKKNGYFSQIVEKRKGQRQKTTSCMLFIGFLEI